MHLRAVLFVWVSTSVSALERTDFIAFTGCYVSNGFASEPYGNLTWCGMGLLCIDTTCQSNTYSNSWIFAQSCTDIFNSDAYQYDYDGDSYTCEDNPDFPPISSGYMSKNGYDYKRRSTHGYDFIKLRWNSRSNPFVHAQWMQPCCSIRSQK